MTFKYEKPINRLYAFALAGAFTIALAGCGGGGGTAQTPAEMPDPQAACEAGGGRYMDGACVTAAELLAMERADIKMKLDAAQAAVGEVDDDSTDAEVSAAEAAVAAAKAAIAAAAGVPAEEKAANTGTVTALETRFHNARTARMTAMQAAADAARADMIETARKLYDGFGDDPLLPPSTCFESDPRCTYPDLETDGLTLNFGIARYYLSEDKQTMVAANHGWEGKRYTAAPEGGGTHEAVFYSNVEEPKEGEKFSTQYSASFAGGTLDETTTEGTAGRVASPSFDHTAGLKRFKLPENNVAVMIPGSYHGVPGTYSCDPADGSTCAASHAGPGFNLGGVTAAGAFDAANAVWTFKPADPDARVMSSPDTEYASYGWWLHKSADDTYTAYSLFLKRDLPDTGATIAALRGTATYRGGAAGLYALSSPTGGTNDAGRFTATATLEADFHTDMISGAINDFTGADGRARNWSVELKESSITNTGDIAISFIRSEYAQTVWTIDGTAAAGDGGWNGHLMDNGDDGVPKVVGGVFHSTYGNDGLMVGAFGANRQEE